MEMQTKFIIDGYDLMCVEFDGEPVDWKLGEFDRNQPLRKDTLTFEEVDFLNEIHETNLITEELLSLASDWFNLFQDEIHERG